ncbi:hypothetical protein RSAG8_00682, partial [Rhizoctonia solani AG-8 WAC10335]
MLAVSRILLETRRAMCPVVGSNSPCLEFTAIGTAEPLVFALRVNVNPENWETLFWPKDHRLRRSRPT